jgi:FkbM family methyltransferase
MIKHKIYTSRSGKKICLEEGCWLSTRIEGLGPYQARNLNALKRLVPKSRTTLDIGANVGMNSVEYADFSDLVYSFEPHPDTFQMLTTTIHANNLKNVILYNEGVGNKKTSIAMKVMLNNDGQNCMARSDAFANGPIVTVNTIDSKNIQNVDVIKIDVEGFELKVVEGARKTISESRPVIQAEVIASHMRRYEDSPQGLYDFLINLDYRCEDYKGKILSTTYVKEKGIADTFFIPNEKLSSNNALFKF